MSDRPYQNLVAWKEAYTLSLWVYSVTSKFPSEERHGLTQQMRRSASSVPINIAEGNTKESLKNRARYFEIALSSLNELHCEMLLSRDLHYLTPEEFARGADHLHRVSFLLTRLLQAVRSRITPRSL